MSLRWLRLTLPTLSRQCLCASLALHRILYLSHRPRRNPDWPCWELTSFCLATAQILNPRSTLREYSSYVPTPTAGIWSVNPPMETLLVSYFTGCTGMSCPSQNRSKQGDRANPLINCQLLAKTVIYYNCLFFMFLT